MVVKLATKDGIGRCGDEKITTNITRSKGK